MILFVFAAYTCELAARWWLEVRAHCAWIAIYTASCARAGEKGASRILAAEQLQQATVDATAGALGGPRARAAQTRERIAQVARLAIGGGPDAAERRAELAGLMGDRLAQITTRLGMSPREKHEAYVAELRQRRLTRRAERKLREEFPLDLRTTAVGSDKSPEAISGAVNEGNRVLKSIETKLDQLRSRYPGIG